MYRMIYEYESRNSYNEINRIRGGKMNEDSEMTNIRKRNTLNLKLLTIYTKARQV